jgi:Uncharacterised protein family (UPF0175)
MRRRGWFKGTVAAVAWEAYREGMTVTVEIPDSVAASVLPEGVDPARKLLEDTVAQAYREKKIGSKGVREALGFESRFEVDPFLLKYQIYDDYTIEDFKKDVATLAKVREERAAELAAK